MKVWITKYLFRNGIQEAVVGESESPHQEFVEIPDGEGNSALYRVGRDVFFTREEAVLRAEEMRIGEIARLKNQVNLLESLRFES